ncbi:pleckstrin homology domain-containing family G member 4B isoform X1 [Camelus dromedarius]|uniref:pleckstrin homology domain-containing family G member 4B isoform X1 n=1 Tax=Camelus dromedarius TaxID=9838 RepID=UPI0031196B6E
MALRAVLGRGYRGSGAQDLESLDTCIQNTLSALYPPFEATAATVLWQLFSVAEKLYGGDGLRCLTDFLVPAKRALQHLQQEACARHTGLLFLHEGWPLCVHEKVVVQLASLRGVKLRPGDFYLQITAVGRQSARLVLKCLSRLGRGSEEVAVPEALYGCVFTGEFLDLVNEERNCVPLQNCLLTSGSEVYRTPWSNITDPVFVPTTGTGLSSCPSHPRPQQLPPSSTSETSAPEPAVISSPPQGGTPSKHTATVPHHGGHPGRDQHLHLPSSRRAECESPRNLSRSSDRGISGVSPSEQGPWEPPESLAGPGGRLDPMDKNDGPQDLTFHAEGGSQSSRRQPPRAPSSVEARRWFRKSYMEALQNPMPLGSSCEESTGDEACGSQIQGHRARGARAATSLIQKETTGHRGDPQGIPSQESVSGATGRTLPRRSQSWDKSLRSSRGDTQRASHHSASASPGGLLGGQAVGTRLTGSSRPGTAGSPSCTSCTREEAPVDAEASPLRGSSLSRYSELPGGLLCREREGRTPHTGELPSPVPRPVLEINQELLQSGVVTLPGTRDRQGRAVVQVCTRGPLWSSEHTSSAELTRLLKYLHSIPRKEVRERGLVILVDARKRLATPALLRALAALQNTSPPIIHSILLLVDKESAFRPDKDAIIQCELVGSLKALHRLIDCSQLTADLEGSLPYSHSAWLCFRQKLDPFTTNCEEAIVFLQHSVRSLNTPRTPSTAQEVAVLISRHKAVMKHVLEDAVLVALRLEGGTVLAQLRREGFGASQDCRDAIEAASRLYNQVDEEVHRLVLASNRCLQELESLQEGGDQIKSWLGKGGEELLGPLELLSLGSMKQRQAPQDRQMRYCQRGLGPTGGSAPGTEEVTQDLRRSLSTTASQAEQREGEFCEEVSRWTPQCSECLEHLVAEDLKRCHQETTEPPMQSLPRASVAVSGLGGQQALPQGHTSWLQCQQTRLPWQEACGEAALGPSTPPVVQSPPNHELARGLEEQPPEPAWTLVSDPEGCTGESSRRLPSRPGQATLCGQEGEHLGTGVQDQNSSSTGSSEPFQTPASQPRRHPLKKIMRKTQSFEIPPPESDPRDSHQPGHNEIFIKGVEVTSIATSEKQPLPRPRAESPLVPRNRSLSSPSRIHPTAGDRQGQAESSRLQHIVAEMIFTEREYVRSLGYVIDNYFPEVERTDLPQDLRGKCGVIFGNWEKLYTFHRQHFLQELERCRHCPLDVGRGFLRHEEQFGLYALYSKNKPRSDALLCTHGNAFFKDKQRELGDRMDLASYLLKPVQRLGKYALLLRDLVKEASHCPTREQELGELRAAEDVVCFQLRHGNDLLAMDALRGCDVDLREQGRLRCQDEFLVCCGRKKYLRRVFLFEDLILFSKTQRAAGGGAVYLYTQSFKTAEIGMTENIGDSGLRFEIWFRRRRKPQDTYVLQASSAEVKTAWTDVIRRILWRQALRNRELRMQEMVSMGLGSKPFVDIMPSDAAISHRAIDCTTKGAEGPTPACIAVPSFKRPHSTISDSSTSSSSSQSSSALGFLHLQASASTNRASLLSPAYCPWPQDIHEEDEPEQGSGSPPSLQTESFEPSHCTSGDGGPGLHRPSQRPTELFSDEDAHLALPRRGSQPQHDGGQFITTNKTPHGLLPNP